MIKKLLLSALLVISTTAFAGERITLYWGFSAAANQANFYRALINELNRNQTKYEFQFDTRVGAGGAIAANHILKNPQNTLLGGTTTFYVRPNFDKETGYSVDKFQPVFVQTLGAPVALYSSKFKSITELKKTADITTGISGFGSHSNLMASILNETYPKVMVVNYPSLVDTNRDVLGKFIDTGWNWLAEIQGSVDTGLTTALGLTGTRSVNGIPTLASQGIRGFENASTNTAIVASAEMPIEKVKEIYELLRVANRSPEVVSGYAREFSTPADFTWDQTVQWHKQQVKFWAEQSGKVKLVK
jgi:tripartite-type tricarboxylate transporter receptor subunit TctC